MPHRENGEPFRPPDLAAWPRLELHEELAGARRRVYRATYGSTDVVGRVPARVHSVTRGWPQRPDIASAQTLLHTIRGGDVDLGVMPCGRCPAIGSFDRATGKSR